MATGPRDSAVEIQVQKRVGRMLSIQIFPEPEDEQLRAQGAQSVGHELKRLPSIMVEPSEESEEESGELRWPLTPASCEEEDDPFQYQCIPSANITNKGEKEKDVRGEDGAIHFKRPRPVVPGHLDYSRLTPPASPTSPEGVPPCFRS